MVSFVVVIVAENMKYVIVLVFDCFFLFIFLFFIDSYKHKICWGGRHARLFYFQFFQFIHKKKKKQEEANTPSYTMIHNYFDIFWMLI